MGRKHGPPSYCLHKGSGQAVCRVNGRDVYLGKYGTPESRRAYAEVIARLDAGAPQPAAADATVALTVERYDAFARTYYARRGVPTRQYERVKRSLGIVVELYGTARARDFGPVALEAVRNRMVALGWSRKHVNSCVGCVRRAWRWAASKQLVPASCFEALRMLDGLRSGKSEARETAPAGPVADDVVEATLKLMLPETADMVRLQRLTAMRAGEVCALRAEEIDRAGDVWCWRYDGHKMAHAGKGRVILFGPKAQAVLLPHLEACAGTGYVFSPRRTLANLHARLRRERKSKLPPSQACRRVRKPLRPPGECYTSNSYQKAIRAACDAAGVPRWSSHQLRKAAATAIRAAFGLEAAQHALGHSRADVTQLYADVNLEAAKAVARKVG